MTIDASTTILIVDDEPDILSLCAQILTDLGHTVLTATNGLEAFAIAYQARATLALIVTDHLMPVMSGLDLARRLRGDPYTTGIPLVLMSVAPPDDVSLFSAVIHKPFGFNTLTTCVQRAQRVPSAKGSNTALKQYY